jgi:hypothetical protein
MTCHIPRASFASPMHSSQDNSTNPLRSSDGLKKNDIETELENYLKNNPSLSTDTRVAPFYNKRRSESSPVKKEVSSALSDGEKVAKSVKRRVTKAGDELTNAVTGTPT